MSAKIYLEVFEETAKVRFVTACTLPARMGKSHLDDNQVLLDPVHERISRIHGVIEQASEPGKGFVYWDRSSNGTRLDGAVIRDTRKRVAAGFELGIDSYRITHLVEASPLVVRQTDARLASRKLHELLPGRGLGIKHDPDGCRLTDLNRWTEWHEPSLVTIAMHGPEPKPAPRLVILDKRKAGRVRVNKHEIAGDHRDLLVGDVVEIDTDRFEVVGPGHKHVVCGNAACHLLNPYNFEANCRWCGHHLTGAGGRSLVIDECLAGRL